MKNQHSHKIEDKDQGLNPQPCTLLLMRINASNFSFAAFQRPGEAAFEKEECTNLCL